MNTFHIKVLAIVTMFIDHIGLFFFPEHLLFRVIGRLSFPLFAWLIANGALHTHNLTNYFFRLILFAFISQVPYMLLNRLYDPSSITLNIFFTLSIGLGAIIFIRKTSMHLHWLLISLVAAALAFYLQTDYGGFGVLTIIAFYLFFDKWKQLVISQIIIFTAMSLYFLSQGNLLGVFQLVGLLSLIPLYFYNDKLGPKMKYFFYAIYPLHYFVMYFVLTQR